MFQNSYFNQNTITNMTKLLFFLSLCMLSVSSVSAKNTDEGTGTIKATVTTSDNKPAPFFSVGIFCKRKPGNEAAGFTG
jgi:hypothetical protein